MRAYTLLIHQISFLHILVLLLLLLDIHFGCMIETNEDNGIILRQRDHKMEVQFASI